MRKKLQNVSDNVVCDISKTTKHNNKHKKPCRKWEWMVPQLSTRIYYNGTWPILIQWLIGLWYNDNLT